MKKGKQLGEYSFKATSNRVREDGRLEINFEGAITGFGFALGTMTVTVGDGKSGQYVWHGVSYQESGTVSSASSKDGRYESVGTHKWSTAGVIESADGRTMMEEGIMELATKSWSGKFYEAA